MADPITTKPFFVIDLSGQSSNPKIPDSYMMNHFKIDSKKVKLTSDVSDKTWEVGLVGGRFADGWRDFSVSHRVKDDDVLSFRHDGDLVFHVTSLRRSFSSLQVISSSTSDEYDVVDDDDDDDDDDGHNIFDDDDDDGEDVVVGHDDDNDYSLSEEELSPEKISSKKRSRTETGTETESLFLVVQVTSSSLSRDHTCLFSNFVRSNGLNRRNCEIVLKDEKNNSWTLQLGYNKTTGQAFMCGGWRNFCKNNGFKPKSFCRFKLVQGGAKPVLRLCPNTSNTPQANSSKAKETTNVSESDIEPEEITESASKNDNKIVTLDLKPYMFRSSQLRLPKSFTTENGIDKAGEITIVNNKGDVEWKPRLVSIKSRGQFYIGSCKAFLVANGIKNIGDIFTLEVVKGGTSPTLKLSSKVKEVPFDGYKTPERRGRSSAQALRAEETETRVKKRARVSTEEGPSRNTRALNNSSAVDPGSLQNKKPLQPCSISDQVLKVKQSIVDTLTCVRRFRSELEVKEQTLEDSLLEIDVLGEKIMGISKIFNTNQV